MNNINAPVEEVSILTTLANSQVVMTILKILWWVAVILVFLIIAKIIAGIIRRNIIKHGNLEDKKNNEKIGKLVGNISFYVLMIFSFFIWFEIMGFNVGLILWWVSFWVWLAFKEILGNMIAWIMILYTKEFKMWDIVEIFADQTYFGRIEEISIRYTIIRTLDLRQVVIPNMTLIEVPIKTFSSEEVVKLNVVVEVHYDTDIDKALWIVTETVNSFDFVKSKENTKAFVINFGDSWIEIQCFFLFDPKCWLLSDVAIGEINKKINDVFNEKGIVVPYNTTTITFESDADKKAIQEKLQ